MTFSVSTGPVPSSDFERQFADAKERGAKVEGAFYDAAMQAVEDLVAATGATGTLTASVNGHQPAGGSTSYSVNISVQLTGATDNESDESASEDDEDEPPAE